MYVLLLVCTKTCQNLLVLKIYPFISSLRRLLVCFISVYSLCVFLQLHRVFSRIRDHEEIRERGEDPVSVIKARQVGTTEDPDADLAETANNTSSSNAQGDVEVVEGTKWFLCSCGDECITNSILGEA